MKQRLSILVIVLIAASLTLSVKPAAAGSPGAVTVNQGCGTIDVTIPGGAGFPGTDPIFDVTTGDIVGSITFADNGADSIGHGTFSANPGDVLESGGGALWTVLPCTTGGSAFNPGDGRVDGKPGDRIAVYCAHTTPPTIYAYGIDDDSHGLYLGFANVPDILKKGSVSKSGRNGTVTFGTFGPNVFTAIWNGPYNAFSSGQFGKKFTCNF